MPDPAKLVPRKPHRLFVVMLVLAMLSASGLVADEAHPEPPLAAPTDAEPLTGLAAPTAALDPASWVAPESIGPSLRLVVTIGVLSLAPAVLLMTTCFVRLVIVLSLLRHALGTPGVPSQQVITTLAMFLTLLVMAPVWTESYREGLAPYQREEIGFDEAVQKGLAPIRRFMAQQIDRSGNQGDVRMLLKHWPAETEVHTYDDVPTPVLLPAFLLSELKTAFLIGFQLYLPFVMIDLIVASLTASLGMIMVPPAMVSLPLKLLLFVLVDGWNLVVGMLLAGLTGGGLGG